jgi:HAD superfamily hydrolase (TIGR01549 family)
LISPNGIRAIFFDLDGTLRHNRPSGDHTMLRYAQELGVEISPEAVRRTLRWVHYYWAQSPEMFADLAAQNMQLSDAFWEQYARRALGMLDAPAETAAALAPELNRRMLEEYQPIVQNWVPDEVYATLDTLQQSGFALGVISNRDQSFTAELQELDLLRFFPCAVSAGEVNAWKPDPLIFQPALEWAGVQPQQALYVGDNYFADVIGAQNAGLQPVLLDPDQIFPEATCPVITAIQQLPALLEKSAP